MKIENFFKNIDKQTKLKFKNDIIFSLPNNTSS